MIEKAIKSQYTIQDLEAFRDENGYIDLEKAGIILEDDNSREKRGNSNRIKNWIDFLGTQVLIKEENILEADRNFGVYSELIMEELAKQMGLSAARYDLIKYNGKYGILSESMVKNKETFETTYGIIGETSISEENPDITDYEEIESKLIKTLFLLGHTEKEVENLIRERRKQKILQLFACEADGHIENEGVIYYKDEEGKTTIKMAPMFDNETSLLLDLDEKTLKEALYYNNEENQYKVALEKMLEKIKQFRSEKRTNVKLSEITQEDDVCKLVIKNLKRMGADVEKIAQILDGDSYLRLPAEAVRSKIAFIPQDEMEEDYPYESMSENTLAYIRDIAEDDEQIADFSAKIVEELDIELAIEKVEEKIKVPVPQLVKDIVIPFVKMRQRTLSNIMCYEMPCEDKRKDAKLLYDTLIKTRDINKSTDIPNFSAQIARLSEKKEISYTEGMSVMGLLGMLNKEKTRETEKLDEI